MTASRLDPNGPTPDVFLGGTCGGDMWRTPFEATLTRRGTSFFNPQVDDWQPWMVDLENRCIRESRVVLFPVLGSTLGIGSLGEIGFSVLSVLRSIAAGQNRELIVLIDPHASPDMLVTVKQPDGTKTKERPGLALLQESDRLRALVRSKVLNETWRQGVWLVDSLDAMHQTMETLLDMGHMSLQRTA
jgi:Nucleoside 2-deoxyribosyltransferase like